MSSAESGRKQARGREQDEGPVEHALRLGLPRPLDASLLSVGPPAEPTTPGPELEPGRVIGDFRLVALLGQGGMAQVWEAEQLSLGGRHVALKFVHPERVSERALELFAREARAGGRLSHPGIVTVHGHGLADGLAWIALELVAGGRTLKHLLEEARLAPELPAGHDRLVARLVADVAEAMHVAHEAGVIHRDLKPHNVLLAPGERPKVTDFGLARITDETQLSVSGDVAGTFAYMSPEQVAAQRRRIDHRTDVFSLGVVLYELLVLRRPFEGDTVHQLAAQILAKDPPDPRTIRSRVPRDLAVIVTKALEKLPEKRFATSAELAADLRRFLADEPIHARPPTRVDRLLKWARRNPVKSVAGLIAGAAFVAITALLVANVRANRALAAKTREADERREDAEQQRAAALVAATAERERADEVLRLSALQRLEDLVAEAERLWPAHPENVERYEQWLRRADALVAELPDHRRKLAALEARAERRPLAPATHPRWIELERARRRLEHHARMCAALEETGPPAEPTPAEAGVDLAALPASTRELEALARGLVDPDREEWGAEAQGLVLARRALALAGELPACERARARETLAWALLANARLDDAMAEAEQASAECPGDVALERARARIRTRIETEIDPGGDAERARRAADLADEIRALEAEVDRPPELVFADDQERWWHDQLAKLVAGIAAFADPETGLASSGGSPAHGWGIRRRLEFARTLATRSVAGSDAAARWSEASAAIGDPQRSPRYAGLRLRPQLGLLPLGPDPRSGLWEFAHLQTGAPAERAPDGGLVLREDTGLVLVLLPGGACPIGAQAADPRGPHHDPACERDESPVHEVVLAPFFLAKHEMTQGQWGRIAAENPSTYHPGTSFGGKPPTLLNPVENVSWNACERLLGSMELVLPTEAQWEYAARAGTTSPWWTGAAPESLRGAANLADAFARDHDAPLAWVCEGFLDDGYTVHAPVGSFLPNALGLHDVLGNVSEWCRDRLWTYGGPVRPGDAERIARSPLRTLRGGSYSSGSAAARVACRYSAMPDTASNTIGVRPARRLVP